ncbi:zinc ribbon domain-containing protein [Fischerella sp. JS2]|uniref:zinc ribbon domain-containing protein n=1 Tax=Fischerella sp. JS2 TaxID=2597771 RepID=UPI0028E200EB|nr:zinc ribbon domain-containing protein [Fischerella sp. JS2]
MDITKTTCPRCHQPVNRQAITCPYCRAQLKAYGHPGIPLHRATGNSYLCDSCAYHADDSCNFPQRPYAKECTLYQNLAESELELQQLREAKSFRATARNWIKRNQALLLLLALLLVCLLIALLQS